MNYRKKLKNIKGFLINVDGVLSKCIFVNEKGELGRILNEKDELALKEALQNGFKVGLFISENSENIKVLYKNVGIEVFYENLEYKIDALDYFCKDAQVQPEEVLFIGDDLPDFELLQSVGVSSCPADSVNEILQNVDYISYKNAGEGCVRDIIEQVLKIQDKWNINKFCKKEFNFFKD